MKEKSLYDDNFLILGEWLYSATIQLILGLALAIVLWNYVHWIASLFVIIVTILGALASYIVLKK